MHLHEFYVYDKDLDALNEEKAAELERACEKQYLETAKRIGYVWKPTRALAWEALREAYNQADEAEVLAKRALWIAAASSVISAVSVVIVLLAR